MLCMCVCVVPTAFAAPPGRQEQAGTGGTASQLPMPHHPYHQLPRPTAHLHALELVVAAGKVERGAPLLVALVGVHALLAQQLLERLGVACGGEEG